jgi:hypothetical protein
MRQQSPSETNRRRRHACGRPLLEQLEDRLAPNNLLGLAATPLGRPDDSIAQVALTWQPAAAGPAGGVGGPRAPSATALGDAAHDGPGATPAPSAHPALASGDDIELAYSLSTSLPREEDASGNLNGQGPPSVLYLMNGKNLAAPEEDVDSLAIDVSGFTLEGGETGPVSVTSLSPVHCPGRFSVGSLQWDIGSATLDRGASTITIDMSPHEGPGSLNHFTLTFTDVTFTPKDASHPGGVTLGPYPAVLGVVIPRIRIGNTPW